MRRLSLVLLVAAVLCADVRAEPDPVKGLNETLGSLGTGRGGPPSKAALDAYKKRIDLAGSKVVRPADLCRALTLERLRQPQPDDSLAKVVEGFHDRLTDRACEALRKSMADEDASRRLAALVLIGQTARQESNYRFVGPPGGPPKGLEKKKGDLAFAPLVPDVDKLHRQEKDAAVRRAALTALFCLQPGPKTLAEVLGRGLKSKDTAERRLSVRLVVRVTHPTRTERSFRYGMEESRAYLRALAPLCASSAGDPDGQVRSTCYEAVAQALRSMGLDLYFGWEHLLTEAPDAEAEPKAFAQWAGEASELFAGWKPAVADFDRTLAAALKHLEDDDLPCRLAAHKALEQAAAVRLRVRQARAVALINGFDPKKQAKVKGEKGNKDDNKDVAVERIELDKLFPGVVKAVPTLVKSLGDKEVRVRLAALYVLETMGADAAPAAAGLVTALTDDNRFVRWGAARALRNAAPAAADKAVAALAKALEDDSPDVRNTAAVALGRCSDKAKDAVAALSKALAKGDVKMRPLAAKALGEIGPAAKAARAELIAALLDELPGVRAAAAWALGRTGALDDKAKAALLKATEDGDDGVSFAAAEALQAAK